MRDPYEVLGVSRAASEAEIKAAFRRLAAQHHPDRNPDDPHAHTRFKEINGAYQVLSDPDKRAAYDRYGAAAFQGGGRGGPDVVDFGGLDEIFGDILGAFGFRSGDRGEIRKTLQLTFEEAAHGCEKEITYERLDICDSCRGTGGAPGARVDTCTACGGRGKVRFQQALFPIAVERPCSRCRGRGAIPARPCPTCGGAGVAKTERTLSLDIPAGIEAGSSRTVTGAGHRVRPERPPGDLEILIDVLPHPFFRRSGDDVLCRVPITFTQAALGGEVEVPTLDGKVKMKIPPATQSNSVLRIKNKGFPRRLRGGRGDQLVEVAVEIPTHLSERARSLLEELGRELGEDVQPQRQSFMDKLKNLFG